MRPALPSFPPLRQPGKTQSMRLFFALKVPLEIRKRLLKMSSLIPESEQLRWVRSEQVHLTLLFLGEQPQSALPPLRSVAQTLATHSEPFTLQTLGLGSFPGPRGSTRVVWAGLEDSTALSSLAENLHERVMDLGQTLKKSRFRPHLTLARRPQKKPVRVDLSRWSKACFGSWTVQDFHLIHSTLGRNGPVYQTLGSYKLGDSRRNGENLKSLSPQVPTPREHRYP